VPKRIDQDPTESAALGSRIDEVVRSIGSRAEAARIAGLTVRHLTHLIAGRTANPAATMLSRLADAGGVNLEWLVTGRGQRSRHAQEPGEKSLVAHGPRAAPAIDHEFLGRVGDALMKAHRAHGVELPIRDLCQLAGEEYEKLAELELDEDGQIAVANGLQAKWEKRLASESLSARKVGA